MTDSHREVELKFDIDPGALAGLKRHPALRSSLAGAPKRERLRSVYFDTEDCSLHKAGISLRVRRNGACWTQTLKIADGDMAGLFDRRELETEILQDAPDLSALSGPQLAAVLGDGTKELAPIFETRVERTSYRLENGSSEIELAVDRGEIDTGRSAMPLSEVELELKRGEPAELFRFARFLLETAPMRLAVKSKSAKGHELLTNLAPGAAKAEDVPLRPGMSVREAFQISGRSCLRQVVENEPAMRAGSADAVHQMRIGLRRLRAAMSVFSGIVSDERSEAIKAELKWVARALGAARDLDVLIQEVLLPMEREHPGDKGLAGLHRDFEARRREAYASATEAVDSPPCRMLILDTLAWIETGAWATGDNAAEQSLLDTRIEDYAREQLARRRKKIRKKGKHLGKLDAETRHKLRIECKKLRYAAEFFAGVFDGKKRRRRREDLLENLKALQDALGDLNDIAVRDSLIEDVAALTQGPRSRAAREAAAERIAASQEEKIEPLIGEAENAYDGFAEASAFWKR